MEAGAAPAGCRRRHRRRADREGSGERIGAYRATTRPVEAWRRRHRKKEGAEAAATTAAEVEGETKPKGGKAAAAAKRTSKRARAEARPRVVSRSLRGVPRTELPGQRVVVTYSEEEALAAGESRPSGGHELVGCFIEVHWPLDAVWYRAQVVRFVEKKGAHEIVYSSDGVKEVIDLSKEEWKHVVKLVKTAYRGTVIRGSDESDYSDEMPNPSLLIHFDGYEFDDEAAECWVDENGEDDWCWEHAFKPAKSTTVVPALQPAVVPIPSPRVARARRCRCSSG